MSDDDVNALLEESREMFRNGDYYESLDRLFAVAREYPDDHNIVIFIGDVYLEAGDYGQAKRYYERARDMQPDDTAPYNALGRLYDRMDRRAEAIPFWQAAADRSAGYQGEKARGMLATVAQRFGEAARHFLEARRLLGEEEEATPGDESERDAWLGYMTGYSLMRDGRYAEAKPYLEHASKGNALAYFYLGVTYKYLHQYEDALRVFERVWDTFSPRLKYEAGRQLFRIHLRRGEFKKAWKYLWGAATLPGVNIVNRNASSPGRRGA
jgi:tetratricopeptide (TPR) repeat protein